VIGDVVLPALAVAGKPRVDVGGISGAYFDAARGRLYTVVDDRERPRVLGFELTVSPAVTLARRELVPLEPPAGATTLDAEGIAPAPSGNWFVSSEGDRRGRMQPVAAIHEYTREGKFVRTLPLPPAYANVEGDEPAGMRLNLSIEALGATADGRWLFAGLESSLLQDGPAADFTAGAVVRLLRYDLQAGAAPPREYAYRTDPMRRPAGWTAAAGDSGVVDVVALSGSELLVLERAYVAESDEPKGRRENIIRIYRVHLDPGAEVSGRYSLAKTPPAAVLDKHLVLDLADIAADLSPRLRRLENFEAIALGPRLPDGGTSVLLMSDDNFSTTQVTALVALRWAAGHRASR
jgi:3-phytase